MSATLILNTPSLADPCRCTVSPTSNSKSLSVPATRFLESTQMVVMFFFFLPNSRLAGPGRLPVESLESVEICGVQCEGRAQSCCVQGEAWRGDCGSRGAAVNVAALALAEGAAAQKLAGYRRQEGSHVALRLLKTRGLSESACRSECGTSRLVV